MDNINHDTNNNETIIEWNSKPIISPKNYNIANNRIHDDLDTLKCIKMSKHSLCKICNKYYNTKYVFRIYIDCKTCLEYISPLMGDCWRYRFGLIICDKCSISADICTSTKICTFCESQFGGYNCYNTKHGVFDAVKRTNELFEPLKWEWNANVYGYKIDNELHRLDEYIFPRRSKLGNDSYIIYCDQCSKEGSLQKCKHNECSNLVLETGTSEGICVNHKCVICNKHTVYVNPDQVVIANGKQCITCHGIYCATNPTMYNGRYQQCGSMKHNQCKDCYVKKEKDSLMLAIHDNTSFCKNVIKIIYQYTIGIVIECSNYKICGSEICIGSALRLELPLKRDMYRNEIYYYSICDESIIEKHQKYLTKIQDEYFRIFCKKCIMHNWYKYGTNYHGHCRYNDRKYRKWRDENSIHDDDSNCDNYDIGFVDKGINDYVCLNHYNIDIAETQCDFCLEDKKNKKWLKKMTECTMCEKRMCLKCKKGIHTDYCRNVQMKEVYAMFKDFDSTHFNQESMDYDFATSYKEWRMMKRYREEKVRKLKKMKSNKSKSYWKRKNDKFGNAKYRNRCNKQRLFLMLMSSN